MTPPSDQALDYIRTISDVNLRRNATDYASMDTDEFKARFGPAFDDLEKLMATKFDEVLAAIKKTPSVGVGPLTRAAMWIEETPPRRITTTIVGLGAVVIGIIEALTK